MKIDANRRKLKVLIVSHARRWNGETEYALAAARAEARMGMEVTLAAAAGATYAHYLEPSILSLELPGPRPDRAPLDFLRDLRWLANLIGRGGYDLIHSVRSTSHLLAALAGRGRAPLIHLRGAARVPSGNFFSRFLYRKLTDAVIVSSPRIRDRLLEKVGMPSERVHLLLAPVDVRRFRPAPPDPELLRELSLAPGTPVVLMVARLAPVKGHRVLLEAMARVSREFPRAALVLAGKPWQGEPENLKRLAAELGIADRVVFAGLRRDIPRFIAAASVCVLSSLGSEENSRAVSEYMAGGRPVAATSVGVVPALVAEGKTGYLVPPGDPAALGDRIADILRDPERGRKMGKAGRASAVANLSEEVFVGALKEILNTLQSGKVDS